MTVILFLWMVDEEDDQEKDLRNLLKRENLQKELFGLTGEHRRDQSHDASYKMPIELKTKHASKTILT